ncbi:hypothetical protein [Nocardia wallacei]|uniref:hypothetical protein n=1 Tax=Nocardia wallacei TaxID=480035 RepID=UPI00165690B9|nr:hypothetical protein [Nocardia wallacei]
MAVAVLAVAGHGAAGGGYPGSGSSALLVLTAGAVGMCTGGRGAAETVGPARLFAMLTGGQLAGHAVLTATVGHAHGAAARETARAADLVVGGMPFPSGWMLLAHLLAALLCAMLIGAAERLYRAVSQAVRSIAGVPGPPPVARAARWPGAAARTYRFLRPGAIGSRAPPVWA